MNAPDQTPLPLTPQIGSLLCDAMQKGKVEVLKDLGSRLTSRHFLIPSHEECTPLHKAAIYGLFPWMASILSPAQDWLTLADFHRGAFQGGTTPLHPAAGQGRLEAAAALLGPEKKGFSQEELTVFTTNLRYTPLHAAAQRGEFASYVAVLKMAGEGPAAAPLLMPGSNKKTPLQLAEESGCLRTLFVPALWAGRTAELMELTRHVSEEGRRQVDLDRVLHETLLIGRRRIEPAAFRGAARAALPLTGAESWKAGERRP